MTNLKILGTGCPKCQKLTEATEEAARELGIEYEIEKVKDLNSIMAFGVMLTPALVVNGEVKTSGRIPDSAELKRLLV